MYWKLRNAFKLDNCILSSAFKTHAKIVKCHMNIKTYTHAHCRIYANEKYFRKTNVSHLQ